MNWASWILIIFYCFGAVVAIALNGQKYPLKYQIGKSYNGALSMLVLVLEAILIYYSGGFK